MTIIIDGKSKCRLLSSKANHSELFKLHYFRDRKPTLRRWLPVMIGTTHDNGKIHCIGASHHYPTPNSVHPEYSEMQKAMRKSLLGNFVWPIDEKIQKNINSDAIDILSGLQEDELLARESLTSVDWAVFRCEHNIYKYRPHEYEPECSK